MTEGTTLPSKSLGVPVRSLSVEVVGTKDAREADTVTLGTASGNDLVLSDPRASRYHCEIRRASHGVVVRDLGSTNGTVVGAVTFREAEVVLTPPVDLRLGDTTLRVSDGALRTQPLTKNRSTRLLGQSTSLRAMVDMLEKVAERDIPVLLLGESGSGKELAAQLVHEASSRKDGPFVIVDCAALTPTLVRSELFGHERGAFTGAQKRHIGAFERANGGTLFLDEVGELAAEEQAMLLGALERRAVQRVGGGDPIPVDVRLVAATHRDLRAAVNKETFRLDLYHRIAVVLVRVPSLRDRADDIEALVEHFLREEGHDGPVDVVFDEAAFATLRRHDWPGNVRELRNVVAATLALGRVPEMEASEVGEHLPVLDRPYKEARAHVTQDFERRYLERLLERAEGNVRRASRIAKMDRSYLIQLLDRHDLR